MAEDIKKIIHYDRRSFIINGKRELLIGGEFHYFRTPHELWEDRIVKMKRCGCNQVTTYIPWNWHEPREGQERWAGDQDLVQFIKLCQKHEMFLVVKPGPYICAEWDFGGHPDWLLGKKIRLRVLNDQYLAYVEKWYRRVADVIRPYLVTRGGNIIAIQVENEYDHLIHFGDEKIPVADAITYFKRLEEMMNRFGIDIPKFANEAAFLRGGSIIDTRTYYPSIPWFWKWELTNYDNNIENAKKGQPDCPTMILELQSGWFTMFGQPPFEPPVLLTEAVTASALAAGASFLNLYMFVGGTTFPYWGCRGDIFDLYPPGTGTTTSFDFGGSPIREWGELMPGRYDWVKIFNLFCHDFKSLILESDEVNNIKPLSGGEQVELIRDGRAEMDVALASPSEKFRVITKRLGDQHIVCARNMGDDDKVVDLGWADTGAPVLKGVTFKTHESFILPVGVDIPGTDIKVVRSTSSLLFARQVDGHVAFGLFGKPDRAGETVLNVPAAQVKALSGEVRISGGDQAVLNYTHRGVLLLKVKEHVLVILDQDLASKVEEVPGGVLIADTYFIRDMIETGNILTLKAEMRNDSNNRFWFIGGRDIASVAADGRNLPVRPGAEAGQATFEYHNPADQPVRFEWLGGWKVKADIEEAGLKYHDASWRTLEKPVSLEEAGLLQHGYIWYRMDLRVPKDAKDVALCVPGNNNDRFYIYINGKEIWCGITDKAWCGIQEHLKPGKNVVAVLYENFYHNKSHPHEGAIQKYSGLMEPVLVTGNAGGKPFKRKITKFKVREQLGGELQGYAQPDCDDSKWLALAPARKYVVAIDQGTLHWLRRKFRFECKPGWRVAVKLHIPDAKDRLTMFINGRPLGLFEHIGPQFDFYIPETFLQAENTLAIVLEGHKTFMDVAKAYLIEPELGTYYEAREVEIKIMFK